MTQSQRDIKLKFYKNLFLGMIMMMIAFWVWNRMAGNPINDLRLILNGKIVKGYITNADEFLIENESNDRVKTGYQHVCKYYFTTIKGVEIIDSAVFGGQVPDYLKNLNNTPYQVEIEYLPNNPRIHKVRDFDFMDFREWLIKKMLIGGVLLIGLMSVGFVFIRKSYKQYKIAIRED